MHRKIAKFLNANLYVPRLYGHGLNEKEPMLNYNNNDFWESAKEAISVAKALGDKVILLGTSHGGVLSLCFGTDPSIAAICLFAPNIEVYDPLANLLSKPWGLQMARLVRGSKYHNMNNMNIEKKKTSPALFLRQVRQELQKVTWPQRRDTFISSGIVILLIILFSLNTLSIFISDVLVMVIGDPLGPPDP